MPVVDPYEDDIQEASTPVYGEFKINNVDVNALFPVYEAAPTQIIPHFHYIDSTEGSSQTALLYTTLPTAENTWEIAETVSGYVTTTSTPPTITTTYTGVKAGSFPRVASSHRLIALTEPATYHLYVKAVTAVKSLILKKEVPGAEQTVHTWVASDFVDNTIPSRLIFMLQGAGGGGSAHMYHSIQLRDNSGAGGGAGGFVAGVLKLDVSNAHYKIIVGAGGVYGKDSINNGDGGDGGDSKIQVVYASRTDTVVTAGGGEGSVASHRYDVSATAGDGGSATIDATNLVYQLSADGAIDDPRQQVWIVLDNDPLPPVVGQKGGSPGNAGGSTRDVTVCSTFDTTYHSYSLNKYTLSAKTGGQDCGGGASLFADGAVEGETDATLGAGGGGARAYSSFRASSGGDGLCYLFY